jgi:hypothetical protein
MPDIEIANVEAYINNPHWTIEDNIAINIPSEIVFDYCLYYNGEFRNPIIFINDNHLLSGQMGATLPANLVTAIPCELNIKQLSKIKESIDEYDKGFKGYITLRFSLYNKTLYYQKIFSHLQPDYFLNILNLCHYEDVDSYLEILIMID